MHKLGHIGFNILLYIPVFMLTIGAGYENLAIGGLITVILTCTLPDIDMKLPLIEHRGITHTAWFVLLMGIGVGSVFSMFAPSTGGNMYFLFGTLVGVVSGAGHLIGDSMTHSGIHPWYPVNNKWYCLDLFAADSALANYGFLILGFLGFSTAFWIVEQITGPM